MKAQFFFNVLSGCVLTGSLFAQIPVLDQSTLNGRFNFVYGVYQRGNASVSTGTLTFDGRGRYDSISGATSSQGWYRVNPDGTGSLTNFADPTLPPLSLRVGTGAAV